MMLYDVKTIRFLSLTLVISSPWSRYHLTRGVLSQRQILGIGNLPQVSAPVCINMDISSEMAAQSVQRNHAFCVTASDWSPITSA